MVHWSMRNGLTVAGQIVYKDSAVGVGGFRFFLLLPVPLKSKATYDFETASTGVLS